ncbi:MAG: Gfo/Idh/MocA family oxidoreductase [Nitrosarchaeum sp.]
MNKILIVGLGSMGKRRIRNLQKLGYKQLIGFDLREDRIIETRKKYKIPSFNNFEYALKEKPTIMIIATPPHLHKEYAEIAIKNDIHVFLEVNLLYNHVESILKFSKRKSIVVCPSSTMRYHPVVKKLKILLKQKKIGKIYSIHHHVGHFLPNWHPWENYKDFFVSRKETGGARELVPVELNWLTYVFSDIKSVFANIGKISKLDVDIDDFYQIFLEFKNHIPCTINIDVFSIPSVKETKIIGEKGTIFCDFNKNQIKLDKDNTSKLFKIRSGKVASGYKGITPSETLYEEEIQDFLNSIKKNQKCSFSLTDELRILKILNSIEKSSKLQKKLTIV